MRIVFYTGSLETIPSNPPKPNLAQRFVRIVCPSKGHPSRTQTLFKSAENQSNLHLYQ